jgi:EAL domain-containing protein (putative c-di-GMP-specific phosphodiesterase class I)
MSSLHHLTSSDAVRRERPRYRTSPRISFQSGTVIGRTIRVSADISAAVAIDLACTLVQETGLLVSLAAPGSFPALPALAATALARTAVSPEHLELTVSNPALEEAGIEALLALSALRDLGVGIALRGFGRGKIAIVPRLPLSSLILSPLMIRDIPGNAAATMLLHTLLGLARSQALGVVATGIETEAQRAILSGIGCNDGEGSLFGSTRFACDNR